MTSRTDPNQVRLTGENNYMRLHSEENGPMTTRASHWLVLVSPGGPGQPSCPAARPSLTMCEP